jgi:hypothetical protein
MVGTTRSPLGSIALSTSASAKQVGDATGRSMELEDQPFTNLAPDSEDLSDTSGPSPAKPFAGGFELKPTPLASRQANDAHDPLAPSSGVVAMGPRQPFGLSDQALSRLEAGLRAQREQLVAPAAQPVPARLPSAESPRAADLKRPARRPELLRLVPLVLLGTAITAFVAYTFVSDGAKAPNNVPVEGIEPARAPDPAPVVEVDPQAKISTSIDPLPLSIPETKSLAAEAPLPSPTSQAILPMGQSLPAPITPSTDATTQRTPRVHKKRPVARPSH